MAMWNSAKTLPSAQVDGKKGDHNRTDEETVEPTAPSQREQIHTVGTTAATSPCQSHRFDNRRIAAAPAESEQQGSHSNYGSARESVSTSSSSTRALSSEELEKGAEYYHKRNSTAFDQALPVHNDDHAYLQFSRRDGQDQEKAEEDLDLEAGEKRAAESVPVVRSPGRKPKSVCKQFLQTSAGGHLKLQGPNEGPKAKGTGGKSRLGTLILEQSWFTVYKRLYLASLILNLAGMTWTVTGNFPYAKSRATLFSLGNILMCVLVRSEVFLRVMFWLAVHLLGYSWIPVRVKTMTTAFLQSVGGIHSGCGLGAVMWLVYALVQTIHDREKASAWILAVAFGILLLLVLSSLAAFPVFRHVHHNVFERVHRFAGWSSLCLVWVYVLLSSFWDPVTRSYRISGKRLLDLESLWLTVATTIIIFLPWLTVRKVEIETVVPVTKLNSLLHFEGGVKAGLLARISRSPFSEWHAFGIISDGLTGHTILAGAVGDFTKSLVERPPTHMWVRSFHFAGLPYLTNMYQRVLLVATGSGICVFLSFVLQQPKANVHVIWIAKKIRESYGDRIWEAIKDLPSEKLTLIDTAVSGRPKTTELVVTKAKEYDVEVVIVTSNPMATNEIVNGCKALGVPAFGPIWDS